MGDQCTNRLWREKPNYLRYDTDKQTNQTDETNLQTNNQTNIVNTEYTLKPELGSPFPGTRCVINQCYYSCELRGGNICDLCMQHGSRGSCWEYLVFTLHDILLSPSSTSQFRLSPFLSHFPSSTPFTFLPFFHPSLSSLYPLLPPPALPSPLSNFPPFRSPSQAPSTDHITSFRIPSKFQHDSARN